MSELIFTFEDGSQALAHHGIKGMKWGVRRYQNKDGSLTNAGKRREYTKEYNRNSAKIRSQYNENQRNIQKQYRKDTVNAYMQYVKDSSNASNKRRSASSKNYVSSNNKLLSEHTKYGQNMAKTMSAKKAAGRAAAKIALGLVGGAAIGAASFEIAKRSKGNAAVISSLGLIGSATLGHALGRSAYGDVAALEAHATNAYRNRKRKKARK